MMMKLCIYNSGRNSNHDASDALRDLEGVWYSLRRQLSMGHMEKKKISLGSPFTLLPQVITQSNLKT